MKTYIALLRGINVSGHKKILMADLRKLMEEMNFKNIQTYIQSGNIIFDFEPTNVDLLSTLITNKIKLHYGFEVPTIVKTPLEIEAVIKKNPFYKKLTTEAHKIYVVFLSEIPEENTLQNINPANYLPDEFIIDKNIIYLSSVLGAGKSKLSINLFENKLKVNATARNWRTVNKLLELSKSI